MKTVKIYTLERIDTGMVVYVGGTKGVLYARLSCHHTSPASKALEEFKRKGIRFAISLIEECPENEVIEIEQYWIDQFRTWGFSLVNAPFKKPYH